VLRYSEGHDEMNMSRSRGLWALSHRGRSAGPWVLRYVCGREGENVLTVKQWILERARWVTGKSELSLLPWVSAKGLGSVQEQT
jgi:hypothetical protein